MGHVEANLVRQARRSGEPISDRILNAPELQQGLKVYLDAFKELDGDRTGLNPIPFISIVTYAQAYRFDEEQSEKLHYFIRKMDRVVLEKRSEVQPSG